MSPLLEVESTQRKKSLGELRGLKERYIAWMTSTQFAKTTISSAHADMESLLKYLEYSEVTRIADVTPTLLTDYSLNLRE